MAVQRRKLSSSWRPRREASPLQGVVSWRDGVSDKRKAPQFLAYAMTSSTCPKPCRTNQWQRTSTSLTPVCSTPYKRLPCLFYYYWCSCGAVEEIMQGTKVMVAGLVFAYLLAFGSIAQAQSHTQAGSVEASLKMGGYFFLNDSEGLKDTFNYRITGSYNFSDLLGAELAFDFSPKEVNQVSIIHLHLDVLIYPWVHDWIVPFVGVGPTFSTLLRDDAETDSDPGANVLLGVKLYPWQHVGFRLDARYIVRVGTASDEPTNHDMIASLGLFVTFGGEEEVEEIILDTDGDGFLDPDDVCPTVPGVASAKGCPDKDGDTLADADDACPDVAGSVENNGCPDSDEDGLVDGKDRCPTVAGPTVYSGCPDGDADTVVDIDDRCPKIPGEFEFQGCPPPPPEEIVQRYSGVIQGIFFEFDSDVILSKSFPVLDEAVEILKLYPHLLIMVEGHTSSEGEKTYNLELSQRRAASVRRYMVEKGIAEDRIESEGYGSDRAIAENDTEKNRAKNRRIEFKILRQ
jgi:outer membrane protein OmpA-like peptidoglycan-associated protein